MKYLKSFESVSNTKSLTVARRNKIIRTCDKYGITNYTINDNGTIDVDGDVILWYKRFLNLPLSFNIVNGKFDCSNSNLTSLKGSPIKVSGNFMCNNNKLTSLEYCPKIVGGSFNCASNKIENLKYFPDQVSGSVYVWGNLLTSLIGINLDHVDNFSCQSNKLTSLEGCPKYINGYFLCYENLLDTLKNGPISVSGDYELHHNKLIKSLKYLPESIGGKLIANNCSITSFEYCPTALSYDFKRNEIKSFEFIPSIDKCKIGGNTRLSTLLKLIGGVDNIETFNDYDVVRDDGDTILINRLNHFLEDIGEEVFSSGVIDGYKLDFR